MFLIMKLAFYVHTSAELTYQLLSYSEYCSTRLNYISQPNICRLHNSTPVIFGVPPAFTHRNSHDRIINNTFSKSAVLTESQRDTCSKFLYF